MGNDRNVIGVIGGLGNEAMVDLAVKMAKYPEHTRHSYIFFGNSRLAYKPHEVEQDWFPTDEPELRKHATAIYTAKVMQYLGCGAMGLACNSAHELFREVLADIPVNFVDMLRETALSLKGEQDKVLIMGVTSLVESGLYAKALVEQGVAATKSSPENQQKIMSAIYDKNFGIKTAKITAEAEALLCEVISDEYKKQGCSKVILGCTELPLAITDESCDRFKLNGMLPADVDVIDASSVLAQVLIKSSGQSTAFQDDLTKYHVSNTDWFTPMTFKVGNLTELATIQQKIFELTASFLAEQGKTIAGSYMHLPTLFIVGDVNHIDEKLSALELIVHRSDNNWEKSVSDYLDKHFEAMEFF